MEDPIPKRLDDPSQDFLRSERSPLTAAFRPRSVAVIGATARENSVGRSVLFNLTNPDFPGKIYPVNPQRSSLFELPCYPSILHVPEPVDLAIIVTPAATVPELAAECIQAGAKATVVISAGFRESGAQGQILENQLKDRLSHGSMRVIGPNCLGIMNPSAGLNATFAQGMARAGNVAFLSQSGALLTAILGWSLKEKVGFSGFVSTGSMLDVGWGDLIDYFADDPNTRSILIYMESIGDARSFLSAAREVALTKPIIVLKAGRSPAASKAAASHTGALTGSDDVLDAAFRRVGVLRVESISDLFHMADLLSKQPRPRGPRLTILTNAGGPAVLATDALVANGGEPAPLSPSSLDALNALLPAHWSHGNPIDILGDADAERYAAAMKIALSDPGSDALLTILAPQAMTKPLDVAEATKTLAQDCQKPLLASWMGGEEVAAGQASLNAAGIPTFAYPDTAARAFNLMWRYSYNIRGIYETPVLTDDPATAGEMQQKAQAIIASVRSGERSLLTEYESKQMLAAYGITTVPTFLARTEEEATALASQAGFPVVLKLHSESVTHKTDVGGVKLNLADAAAVREAYRAIESGVRTRPGAFLGVTVQPMVQTKGYELIVGSTSDALFGPVIIFGSGGELVEVYRDRALALPPLNSTLALRMMEQTRIFKALEGVRGRNPVDLKALQALLVRFSRLVIENPAIKEADINPLLATPSEIVALDARFILHPKEVPNTKLPKPAIRAYPIQYASHWNMKDGTEVTIRPLRPEDEPLIVRFHGTLSEQSVYQRFFHPAKLSERIAHERLVRICFLDYDREIALLVAKKDPRSGEGEILGVGRMSKLHESGEAELAVLVRDQYQRRGIGAELVRRLRNIAGDEGIDSIRAYVLQENVAMQRLLKAAGFQMKSSASLGVLFASLHVK